MRTHKRKRGALTRREALAILCGTAAASLLTGSCVPLSTEADDPDRGESREGGTPGPFAALEDRVGGRLGVCVLNHATGAVHGHRLDERFGMCSTFKVLLAGVVLRLADSGGLDLERFVAYDERDLVFHAPVTTGHLSEGGMTIGALAEAAQKTSDNVAANLLIRELGGPDAFTRRLREYGDPVTRLDRYEPEMNFVPEGEVRDTTSPRAMASSVAAFVLGDLLGPERRAILTGWMEATRTGRKRIRAGLPEDWRAGDKTGTGIAEGMVNKYNDVAVVWPSAGPPHAIAAYYDAPGSFDDMRDEDQAVLAEVGRIAATLIG